MAKRVTVYSQPGWMFCGKVKEYLSQKQIPFDERDITKDPSAILELQKLGFMSTPVTVVEGKVIVGFDVSKLDEELKGWPENWTRMRVAERAAPVAAAIVALSTLACCLPLGFLGAIGFPPSDSSDAALQCDG